MPQLLVTYGNVIHDLVGKESHISTTIIFHTLDPHPRENSEDPQYLVDQ